MNKDVNRECWAWDLRGQSLGLSTCLVCNASSPGKGGRETSISWMKIMSQVSVLISVFLTSCVGSGHLGNEVSETQGSRKLPMVSWELSPGLPTSSSLLPTSLTSGAGKTGQPLVKE